MRGNYNSIYDYKIGDIIEKENENSQYVTYEYESKILDYIDNTEFSKLDMKRYNGNIKLSDEFKRKVGLAIHYYFEHIKNNLEVEKVQAKSALLMKYGNLLGIKKIEEIMVRVDKFIEKNREIYDYKYKVYTEFEIINNQLEKRIIDRINIDENNKQIIIYDYKTGEDPNSKEKYIKQLEEYKLLIEKRTNGECKVLMRILEI